MAAIVHSKCTVARFPPPRRARTPSGEGHPLPVGFGAGAGRLGVGAKVAGAHRGEGWPTRRPRGFAAGRAKNNRKLPAEFPIYAHSALRYPKGANVGEW
jgi:hypothetical protein